VGWVSNEGPRAEDKTGVAKFDDDAPSLSKRIKLAIHNSPTIVPLVILILSILVFGVVDGARFFSLLNLSIIIQQVTIIAIVAAAQTLVILTAGIDLSVGSILILSEIIAAKLAVEFGVPAFIAIAVGIGAATICGYGNGTLISKLKLPPFIATLGTWSIFGSLVIWYSQGETIQASQITAEAPFLHFFGTTFKVHGAVFTYGFLMLMATYSAVWFLLNQTAFGSHVRATGDNEEAARLAGIDTRKTILGVYAIAGLICGVGGWMLIGRVGAASPLAGGTLNIDSITAVVIGGTSLFGGRGSIIASLLGALIVAVFRNGLALGNADVLWQEFSVGCLILLAVAMDQWIRRIAQ
jgi:fructose transport system permease protein